MMAVNFFGEGVLVELWLKKVNGRVGGVARLRLKQRERQFQGASSDFRSKEFVDDRPSLGRGGNECGRAVLDCRSQTGATHLDGQEDLASRVVVELSAD